MTKFIVTGPFLIPYVKIAKSWHKRVKDDSESLKDFWEITVGPESGYRGCYVFSLKVSKGYTPYYVGKAASQSFQKECFMPHKLAKHYNKVLIKKSGTPYMFFVSQAKTKGKWNKNHIADLEKYLIKVAVARNPDLSNKNHTSLRAWQIKGVIGAKPGALDNTGKTFKRLMGML